MMREPVGGASRERRGVFMDYVWDFSTQLGAAAFALEKTLMRQRCKRSQRLPPYQKKVTPHPVSGHLMVVFASLPWGGHGL